MVVVLPQDSDYQITFNQSMTSGEHFSSVSVANCSNNDLHSKQEYNIYEELECNFP